MRLLLRNAVRQLARWFTRVIIENRLDFRPAESATFCEQIWFSLLVCCTHSWLLAWPEINDKSTGQTSYAIGWNPSRRKYLNSIAPVRANSSLRVSLLPLRIRGNCRAKAGNKGILQKCIARCVTSAHAFSLQGQDIAVKIVQVNFLRIILSSLPVNWSIRNSLAIYPNVLISLTPISLIRRILILLDFATKLLELYERLLYRIFDGIVRFIIFQSEREYNLIVSGIFL